MKVGGKLFPQELSAKGARPADLGHWALGIGESLPCPMPHAQKLHPQGDGVFHVNINYVSEFQSQIQSLHLVGNCKIIYRDVFQQ
jgi:hypothetical protein